MGSKKKNKKAQAMVTSDRRRKTTFLAASIASVVVIAIVIAVIVTTGGEGSDDDTFVFESGQNFVNSEGTDSQKASIVADQKPSVQPSGLIRATWINPQINGNSVSIPASEVQQKWNTHFSLGEEQGNMNFMAYVQDGEMQVRANVCPPCRSIGFSLNNDELVCDKCGTRFDAISGGGISGACKDYPKALVAYEVTGDQIVMQLANLTAAYEDTIEKG